MNARTIKWLAAAVVVLLGVIVFMDSTDRNQSIANGERLLPGLKEQINDVKTLTVALPNAGGSVTIAATNDGWVVTDRDDFPADVGKIRTALLALADAKLVEAKTANADRYEQLAVDDDGLRIKLLGEDLAYELIIGNVAQTNYRYVRIADQEQSWLIDRNPEFPDAAGGWLRQDVLDIDPARIRTVSIQHPDGESIVISKESAEEANYQVQNIPSGRELSYPTVANGIAGALNDLTLDDVKKDALGGDAVLTTFESFDGLTVVVRSMTMEDETRQESETWVSIEAMAEGENSEEADSLNQKLQSWSYRVPEYKANLLVRRYEDILKSESE